jgi:hypothetical protein
MTGGHCCETMGKYCYFNKLLFLYCHCFSYCYCYSSALPSTGYTLFCLYHFRLDHSGLRRAGTDPEGLRHPWGQFRGLQPLGKTPGNAPPHLVPTGNFYLTPRFLQLKPLTMMLTSLGPGALRFLFLELCLRAFYHVSSPPGLWKFIFFPRWAFTMMGWVSTGSRRPLLSPGCLTLGLCPQSLPSVALPLRLSFPVLDTPGSLPSQVKSSRPQEDLDCRRGYLPLTGLGHFRGQSLLLGITR